MLTKTITVATVSAGGVTLAQAAAGGGGSIEDTLRNAASQVPALVVLIFLARFFLAAMSAKDLAFAEAQAKSRQDYLENLKALMSEHQAQWASLNAQQEQNRKELAALYERQLASAEKLAIALANCPARHA